MKLISNLLLLFLLVGLSSWNNLCSISKKSSFYYFFSAEGEENGKLTLFHSPIYSGAGVDAEAYLIAKSDQWRKRIPTNNFYINRHFGSSVNDINKQKSDLLNSYYKRRIPTRIIGLFDKG